MRKLLLTAAASMAFTGVAHALPTGHQPWFVPTGTKGACTGFVDTPRAFYNRLKSGPSYSDVKIRRVSDTPMREHEHVIITATKGGVAQTWDFFTAQGDCEGTT